MALITCPACSHHPVSDQADACPKCGHPIAAAISSGKSANIQADMEEESRSASPTPKAPAPQLDVQQIIAELLKLSQPNKYIRSIYCTLLGHSQSGYWTELAARGDVDAKFLLAVTAQDENSTETDRLMPLALQGHTLSMWQVGYELAKEYSLPSYPRGIEMLKKAAQSGNKAAMCDYAMCLDCAPEDERTYDRLKQQRDQIYESLAREGFPPAMARVGTFMVEFQPYGLPEHKKARMIRDGMQLLMKAAEAGNMQAADELESQYRRGGNVTMSGVEAKFWKDRARELSDQICNCPANAYGIKSLLDSGWITEGGATLIY